MATGAPTICWLPARSHCACFIGVVSNILSANCDNAVLIGKDAARKLSGKQSQRSPYTGMIKSKQWISRTASVYGDKVHSGEYNSVLQ